MVKITTPNTIKEYFTPILLGLMQSVRNKQRNQNLMPAYFNISLQEIYVIKFNPLLHGRFYRRILNGWGRSKFKYFKLN